MRTVKWNPFLAGGCMLLGSALLWAGAARADISTTNPAALVIFPKVVVDSEGSVDTTIQLTNTSSNPVNVRCFYINANGHCSNSGTVCNPSGVNTCGGDETCVPGWQETDFHFRLTAKQPIAWGVSDGLLDFPLASVPAPNGQFNNDSSIPPAPESPMIGELQCVEVGDDELETDTNDLIGQATIGDGDNDIRGYNAIGLQANAGALTKDNNLVLGQEYAGCPAVLILNHFFDGADEPALDDTVTTNLTLAPCSEDLNLQTATTTQVQLLVYNEFEQRFSTSRRVSCLTEVPLSDLDTRPGDADDFASIFNVNVEGTLTGQTLLRGVGDGHGLLAVAEEFHSGEERDSSTAYALYGKGTRTSTDTIVLPVAGPQ